MEETKLQPVVKEEAKEEPKVEEKKVEAPKGFYIAEIPTSHQRVIALGDEVVSTDELLVKMANALVEAGLLK